VNPVPPIEVIEVPLIGVEVTGIYSEITVLIRKLATPVIPLVVPPQISEWHEGYMLSDDKSAVSVLLPLLGTLTRAGLTLGSICAMRRSNPRRGEQAQHECQTSKQSSKSYFQTFRIRHAIFLTLLVI